MKFLPYVFKSLFRKKTRSFLTLGSILLPLFVICLMGTLLRTLERQPSGQGMFRLVTRHKVSLTNWIPEAYRARIQQLGGIEEMSVWCWLQMWAVAPRISRLFKLGLPPKDPGCGALRWAIT